ncbi:mycobactin polyketide synthase MbtD [Mycobacterium cookii]|uniref:Polyketide synthase n=1 Tax=Mycobacterium cookii TaxID=1775 RepID=A0A7I7KVC5_9MYCO|nr:mycobactin polyketide synthase MbtD [Mycobacterium cookii]MCV7328781.1 mycobactin polyketide synthase MbtD [Mycobacterium cookii]BBX45408.1 polyketide synthase [Mycobacterium cookii]
MLAQPLPDGRIPVLLSAYDEKLIGQDAQAILQFLDRLADQHDPTADVAFTLLRLRRVRRHRAVVRAADRTELVAGLSALVRGEDHPLVTRSSKSGAPTIAFVFPGQGNQWQAMGVAAYQRLAGYRAEADRCAEAFVVAGLPSPLPYLCGDGDRDWARTEIQGAQFVHAVSLAQQWRLCGVRPDITVGHSLGEIAAAYVAERISLCDAVALVGARVAVVDRLTGRYAMAALGVGIDDARILVDEAPGWLEVSAVNGPSSTVVSGDRDAVVALTESAQRRGVFTHLLTVDYPGHTSALRPPAAQWAELLPESTFRDGPDAFIGSATGAEVTADTDFSRYWYESLCSTVRFDEAVIAAQKCGADTFVEMSAHPALLYPLVESVDDESVVIVGSGRRDQSIVDTLAANVAAVAAADPGYHWAETLSRGARLPLRGFPNAPMRAVHLWLAPQLPTTATSLTVAVEDWQQVASRSSITETRCSVAIVGDTDGALARLLKHAGCDEVSPEDAEIVAVIAPPIDTLDVTAAVDALAGRVGAGLPDYAAIIGPRCRTVWLLTTDGERVGPDDTVTPAHAALAAMHRSVGFEFPDQTFGSLDIRSGEVDERNATAIVDVLLGEPGVMALRTNAIDATPRRYVRTLRDARVVDSPARGALDNVVITGGSGAIGLRYAQYCIERGARRIVLLSRNGVDAETLKKLAGQHPVEVSAPQCDITDRAALADLAADYAGDGATLLIHTAGIATVRMHADLTGADVAAVSGAKVAGLTAMADVWPLRPECRILACSSVFGVWGGHGHAAYAASNRMLDVLAAQLRSRGVDCTAIRWGLWQDAGVVEGAEIARTERSGLSAMRPDAAVAASLSRYGDDPLIFEADFDRLRVFVESQGIAASFGAPSAAGNDRRHNHFDGRPLADVVRTELAATLHLDGSVPMDPTASLIDLGLDSLLALDLRKRLRRAVGHAAPVAQMLAGISVNELVDIVGSLECTGD